MVGGIAFHKHNFRLRIFGDFSISAGNFSISIAKKHRPWSSYVFTELICAFWHMQNFFFRVRLEYS